MVWGMNVGPTERIGLSFAAVASAGGVAAVLAAGASGAGAAAGVAAVVPAAPFLAEAAAGFDPAIILGHFQAAVGRTVIENQQAPVLEGLCANAVERSRQKIYAVLHRQ